jgi:hypothetical protein
LPAAVENSKLLQEIVMSLMHCRELQAWGLRLEARLVWRICKGRDVGIRN